MKRIFWIIVRVLCYGALVIVAAGAAGLFAPFMLDWCQNQSGGTIKCTSPFYRQIYEFGFTVVMMSIFTGVPALLALGGIFFTLIDLFRIGRK